MSMLKASEIIEKYIKFFEEKGHKRIVNSPLIPQNDPTTLFISSGMQPLIQYFLGEEHSAGKRLVNVQNCFRAADIEEVGDNRHTTFFRMLGNWSLGDYFKKEQIGWYWEFLTKVIGLSPEKLYISVFEGYDNISRDSESEKIWTEILEKENLDPKDRIYFYGADKNWWSRSGTPKDMLIGEPGGPDSEVFFDFGTTHDKKFGKNCHPNCQCGRFLEIGNSVFMECQKIEDGFKPLPNKNVDFGGGLERLLAAIENKSDIFQTSLFIPMIRIIESQTGKNYEESPREMRVIADHLKAAMFLVEDGVTPGNKTQGYVLRRLLRRAALKAHQIDNNYGDSKNFRALFDSIVEIYSADFNKDKLESNWDVISVEIRKFRATLVRGLKEFEKYATSGEVGKPETTVKELSPKDIFTLYESYGFPYELSKEEGEKRNIIIPPREEFDLELREHQALSRSSSAGMFKGGLADHSDQTIMGHTATHLLHQALRDVLGNKVFQTGSNITSERIRFDFFYDKKLTDEEILEVEKIVNEKIEKNLYVHFEIMPLKKAKEIGAIGLFDEKYEDKVKVYFVGDYSVEFCGGPHVKFTGKLKRFKIIKQENIGHGQRRIYAKVGTFL